MDESSKIVRNVLYLLWALIVVLIFFTIFQASQINGRFFRFWPMENVGEFIQLITPLLLVSLFIERTVEVFVKAARAKESADKESFKLDYSLSVGTSITFPDISPSARDISRRPMSASGIFR